MTYKKLLFTFILLFLFLNTASGYKVAEIEDTELDVTPVLRQSRYGPVQVDINKDTTTVKLGVISQFTIRHGIFGMINFTSYNLTYDGMEAYQIMLKQDIILEDKVDMLIGKRSIMISENALRDGVIYFSYIIGDLSDIEEMVNEYIEPLDEYVESAKSQLQYKINNNIEIIRGTKQNATLNFEYDISSYEIPSISADDFHKRITLITRVFPQMIVMDQSSSNYDVRRLYLLLPIRLLPYYFQSPNNHKLNLTEIPVDIYLDLKFDREDKNKALTITSGGFNGDDLKDPILDNDKLKQYKLSIEIKNTPLIPITISIINYKGTIDIEVYVKIKAIFSDTSLYAKNDYPFSPNQYILSMTFTGTVFVYKLVDYVDYRKFQQILAYKDYQLLEKEFIR